MAVVPTSSQGGQVTSVFARTGAVVAAANDYTDAQVQNSPTNILTAGGDILYASAANTLARLAKGADGTVLTLASGLPSWGAGGAFTQLANSVRATDGTIDVQSISQAYNDLLLVMIIRGTNASAGDNGVVRFNNDSSAHYGTQWTSSSATTTSTNQNNSAAQAIAMLNIPAASATAGLFAMGLAYIAGYTSTTWPKSMWTVNLQSLDITSGSMTLAHTLSFWNQASAINRILVQGSSTAALKTGSLLRIYGVN